MSQTFTTAPSPSSRFPSEDAAARLRHNTAGPGAESPRRSEKRATSKKLGKEWVQVGTMGLDEIIEELQAEAESLGAGVGASVY